jgi:arabidopsis histidine kinase 2/3/4 (cytokinin receptor)
LSEFDLKKALEDVVGIMKFQATQKGIKLNFHISHDVPHKIHSDEKRYKQVLFNLIGNSIKFTRSGDSIFVRVSWAEKPHVLEKSGT